MVYDVGLVMKEFCQCRMFGSHLILDEDFMHVPINVIYSDHVVNNFHLVNCCMDMKGSCAQFQTTKQSIQCKDLIAELMHIVLPRTTARSLLFHFI